ncbi:MAG: tRNA pseudouridine(55) synthase TruB [Bacteroidaceae bacterium]|nr:tRNA pseudouridine(55) synthase TruB [Bacteroidaceae bacterium]
MDFIAGEILPFDKPYEWTSFGLVARVRWLLSQKLGQKVKVGHAGTLDPLATGVLLLCTGRATKRIEELQNHSKEYIATLKLGATTASFDMEHPEDATYPTDHITRQNVEEVLSTFVGTIRQEPPVYSACKIGGTRAYHLARRGKEVNLKPKTLTIEQIQLLDYNMPHITLRIECSKGTYIRALARDIGTALHSGAYLTSLRRTRVGHYTADQCLQLDTFPQWLESVDINLSNS